MDKERILAEVRFRFSTGTGKGGQHVNRVRTKVTACFNIPQSKAFSQEEKEWLQKNLKTQLNDSGELCLSSHRTRSQLRNKKEILDRLLALLERGLKKPKRRKPTKMPKEVREAIRIRKKRRSELKKLRKKVWPPH